MSFMLKEIHEQPDVVGRMVDAEQENVAKLVAEIERRDIDFVVMAARGTSDHAAIYGKYLLEIKNSLPVGLADPSVYTLYSAKLKMDRGLVIGISQSGQATDVAEYLEQSKQSGALTAAITNVPGSTLSQIADYTILCHAGQEKGVAATKTYTSTLAALYLLSASLAHDVSHAKNQLLGCAKAMRSALKIEQFCKDKAERYRFMQDGYVIGRGLNYCTALEAALKLAETSYVGMLAYSAADFLHGPIAAVYESEACFLCAPPGKAFSTMVDMAARLSERNAEVAVISSEQEALSYATTPFKLDVSVDEELSPLVYIMPAQLLAYYLALARGFDPDRPRGLSKVTLTR
jgi:glucosamine--fructose-6-phosphate aminotransferase (isomerizing)